MRSRVSLPEAAREAPEARAFAPEERTRRRPTIEQRDVDKFGISVGCPGCIAASRGAPSRHHTEACRKRTETEMTKGSDVVDPKKTPPSKGPTRNADVQAASRHAK